MERTEVDSNKVKEKHLDFLQVVITRHNSNSFILKGWAIAICTAVLTVAGSLKEPIIALVALVPIITFWFLDSFYLANERCFISLYNAVINKNSLKIKNKQLLKKHQVKTENSDGIFKIELEKEIIIKTNEYSMNYIPFKKIARNNWQNVIKSRTIIWFYLMLISFSIALFIGLLFLKSKTDEVINVSTELKSDSLFIKTETPHIIINEIILNDSVMKIDSITK